MESSIQKQLVIKPVILIILSALIAVFLSWFVPHQLSTAISSIAKSQQQFSLPNQLWFFAFFSLALKPTFDLISNLVLLKRWQNNSVPSCPICSYPMLQRIAKRSSFAGQRFWGCYRFPRCTGKIHIG